MIKAIIFDFDGVIHDTFSFHLERLNTFVEGGTLTAEEYRALHDGNINDTKMLVEKMKAIDYTVYRTSIYEGFIAQKIKQEIHTVLQALAKEYDCFIITSGGEQNIGGFLLQNDIHHAFKEILGAETHKSKEVKFAMILEKYNLPKDDVVFVTDTLGDILEANNVGIKTIAVDFGFHDRARLERGNPYAIISDFDHLPKVISQIYSHTQEI